MFDKVFQESNTNDINSYRRDRLSIIKQLKHWDYLTPDEKTRFKTATTEAEITQLLVTARHRAYEADLKRNN